MNELDTVDSLLDVVEGILAENPGKGRIALAHAHVTRGHVALERGDLDRAEAGVSRRARAPPRHRGQRSRGGQQQW